MEAGRRADEVGTDLQGDTAGGLGILKIVDTGEMAVRQGGVGQRPEMLGRLELRRVRRQEQQMDVLGDAQLDASVPPGAIQDEHDLLARVGADLARELGQLDFEEWDTDRSGQMKDSPTRSGVNEANEIPPVVAVLHRRGGTCSVEAPHLLEDWLQADAVLIDSPEFDARLRVRGRDRLDDRPDLFMNASCSAGSARTWRGRGLRRLPSSRTR